MLSRPLRKGYVQCRACEHWCALAPEETARCGARRNVDGQLVSLVYGRPAAIHVDPVEKKPLYHVLPGRPILSLGTVGCCLTCDWCQNWTLSQAVGSESRGGPEWTPERLVEQCRRQDIPLLAFTYNEPAVFVEYARDTARAAAAYGIRSVYVTSGFETLAALAEVEPYLAAANVDLKAFRDETYRRHCGARLGPVLRNIEHLVRETDVWVEVTTLVVPGINDDPSELRDIASFLVELSPDLPWHVSAFHPDHRMRDRPPTPLDTIALAWEIGRAAGLRYVYPGNVSERGPLRGAADTHCPECGTVIVRRAGFRAETAWREPGVCPGCGGRPAGRWR